MGSPANRARPPTPTSGPPTPPTPPEKTWAVLEAAIHEINNHNASGLSFEELYR